MNQLQQFADGIIDYIQRHNNNYQQIEAAINALEQVSQSQAMLAATGGSAFYALLGTSAAFIGSSSYVATPGSTSVSVSSGFCWRPALGIVTKSNNTVAVSFVGQVAGTYYITADASGAPIRTSDATEAMYSVVWSGTSVGTVTKLLPVVWGAADFTAAQSNSALGATYTTLDGLLEAIATKAVAGDLAQTWKMGKLSKAVTGANVTLTAVESNNFAIDFTGTITADMDVAISLSGGPRGWVFCNKTIGPYTIRVKGASGAGVKLAKNAKIFAMHDGTNILYAGSGPNAPCIVDTAFSATKTIDFSFADVVRMTLTGDTAITLTGAVDSQKCILELTQGGAGGYIPSFGAEVNFGANLSTFTFSTDVGKRDKIGFMFNEASGLYDAVAFMPGY